MRRRLARRRNGPRPVQEKNFLPDRGSFLFPCSDISPFAACCVCLRLLTALLAGAQRCCGGWRQTVLAISAPPGQRAAERSARTVEQRDTFRSESRCPLTGEERAATVCPYGGRGVPGGVLGTFSPWKKYLARRRNLLPPFGGTEQPLSG